MNTWNKLRHPGAHGAGYLAPPFREDDLEKLLSSIHAVTTLIYLEIMIIIEYEGNYSDYSLPRYPIMLFTQNVA